MKKYGINWGLVWAANFLFLWPFYLWIGDLLQFPAGSLAARQVGLFGQAFGLSVMYTYLFYFGHGKTLDDPKALGRIRQRTRSRLAKSRFRWLFLWGVTLGVVAAGEFIGRMVAGRPGWPVVLSSCVGLPLDVLLWGWLLEYAGRNSLLTQKIKVLDDGPAGRLGSQ